MGADIHMVLETKCGPEWVGVHSYPHALVAAYSRGSNGELPERIPGVTWPVVTERNYELFAKLAGVRGDGPEPNGVPEDVSQLARVSIARWGGDGHSHSHLSLQEFAKRYASCREVIGEATARRLEGEELLNIQKDAEVICTGGYASERGEAGMDTDVRIVFWFDN